MSLRAASLSRRSSAVSPRTPLSWGSAGRPRPARASGTARGTFGSRGLEGDYLTSVRRLTGGDCSARDNKSRGRGRGAAILERGRGRGGGRAVGDGVVTVP